MEVNADTQALQTNWSKVATITGLKHAKSARDSFAPVRKKITSMIAATASDNNGDDGNDVEAATENIEDAETVNSKVAKPASKKAVAPKKARGKSKDEGRSRLYLLLIAGNADSIVENDEPVEPPMKKAKTEKGTAGKNKASKSEEDVGDEIVVKAPKNHHED